MTSTTGREEIYAALARLVKRESILHIPPKETDDDCLVYDYLKDLEQKLSTANADTQALQEKLSAAEAEKAKYKRAYEIESSTSWQIPFCPDHRDKVKNKSCRECEIERLTKQSESENKEAFNAGREEYWTGFGTKKEPIQAEWKKKYKDYADYQQSKGKP